MKMSSHYDSYPSERAVDGNLNGDMSKGGCAHTQLEEDPWLRVDLLQRKIVQKVRGA